MNEYELFQSPIIIDIYAAMLPGLVLFKVRHISWKKEQKQGLFRPKKNNFITIFSKFVLISDNILVEEKIY